MRLLRRGFIAGVACTVLAAVALAVGDSEVIHLTTPSTVQAGQNFTASVTVSEAPMAVTFTSSPAGFVSYTTTVTSTSQSVSVPTQLLENDGRYTITAAPTAGGPSASCQVAAQPSSINQ